MVPHSIHCGAKKSLDKCHRQTRPRIQFYGNAVLLRSVPAGRESTLATGISGYSHERPPLGSFTQTKWDFKSDVYNRWTRTAHFNHLISQCGASARLDKRWRIRRFSA